MENEKISAVDSEKEISYECLVLENFWEQQNEEMMDEQKPEAAYRNIIDSLEFARQNVCIIADSELPDKMLIHISCLYAKGVRVYLISNDIYDSYKDTIVGKCLIRYSNRVKGTMVLIDPISSEDASAYIGNERLLKNEDKWALCIRLVKDQVKEAYHYFCWNFWRMTDYEVVTCNDIENHKKVGEAPFDLLPLLEPEIVFYNDINRGILTKKLISVIEEAKESIVISAELIDTDTDVFKSLKKKIDNDINCTIIAKLDVRNKGFFNEISNYDNVTLYGFSVNLAQYLFSDNIHGIAFTASLTKSNLENGKENSLCFGVKLDDRLDDLKNIFKQSTSTKEVWKYQKKKALSQITGKHIIREITEEISTSNAELIYEHKEVKIGKITANSLKEIYDEILTGKCSHEELVKEVKDSYTLEPKLRSSDFKISELYEKWEKEKQGLVKKVKYKYTLEPKLRSSDFKISELYEKWKNEKQRLVDYVSDLKSTAENIKNEKSSLFQQFSDTLKRFMLGKVVIIKFIVNNINNLDTIKSESFNKELYLNLSKEANEIYGLIFKHKEEIDLAIDRDIKEQEWLKEKTKLENEVSQLTKETENLKVALAKSLEDTKKEKERMSSKLIELEKTCTKIDNEINALCSENKCLEEIFAKQKRFDKLLELIDVTIKEVAQTKKNKNQAKKVEKAKLLIKKEVCDIMNNEQYYDTKMLDMEKTYGKKNEDILKNMKQYIEKNLLEDMMQTLYENEKEPLEKLESKKNESKDSKNTLELLKKDKNALESKSEKDLESKKEKFKNKEAELSIKQEALKKMGNEFKYESNSKCGDKELKAVMKKGKKDIQKTSNNKFKAFTPDIPSEDLPQVGTLYQQGKKRELAITYWQELEIGESEASRLKAELVCEREA